MLIWGCRLEGDAVWSSVRFFSVSLISIIFCSLLHRLLFIPNSLLFGSKWNQLPVLSTNWLLLVYRKESDGFLSLSPIQQLQGTLKIPLEYFRLDILTFTFSVPLIFPSDPVSSPFLFSWLKPPLPLSSVLSFPCLDRCCQPSLSKNSLCSHCLLPLPANGNSFLGLSCPLGL